MRAEDVQLEESGGEASPAYLALPDARDEPLPGLVVLHEILGLNDDIRRITRRFADAGYVTVAPDLYAGTGAKPICILRALRTLNRGRGPAFDAIDRARGWLAARADVDASRVGVVGFCMGGGFALLYATGAPVSAVATFYGDVPERPESLDGICPVVAGYGARDGVFARAGDRLGSALTQLGVDHEMMVYANAGHSYMNQHGAALRMLGPLTPMRAGYVEDAAEDSWRRMLAFFEKWLIAERGAGRGG